MATTLPFLTLDQIRDQLKEVTDRLRHVKHRKMEDLRADLAFSLDAIERLEQALVSQEQAHAIEKNLRVQRVEDVQKVRAEFTAENTKLREANARHQQDAQAARDAAYAAKRDSEAFAKTMWSQARDILLAAFPGVRAAKNSVAKDPAQIFDLAVYDVFIAQEIELEKMQQLWNFMFSYEAQNKTVQWFVAAMTDTKVHQSPPTPGAQPSSYDIDRVAATIMKFRNLSWHLEFGRMAYYGWTKETVEALQKKIQTYGV